MAKAGRPKGAVNKDKPFKEALRLEAALAESGEETPAKPGSIRWAARQLLIRAAEDTASFREAADRLDGKPAQAVELSGDAENPISHKHQVEVQLVEVSKQERENE